MRERSSPTNSPRGPGVDRALRPAMNRPSSPARRAPENLPEELVKNRLSRLDTRRALADLCKSIPGLDEILLPRGIQADALTRKSGSNAPLLKGLSRRITQDAAAWGAFRTAVQEQIPPETFEAVGEVSEENLGDLSGTHTVEGLLLAAVTRDDEPSDEVVEMLVSAWSSEDRQEKKQASDSARVQELEAEVESLKKERDQLSFSSRTAKEQTESLRQEAELLRNEREEAAARVKKAEDSAAAAKASEEELKKPHLGARSPQRRARARPRGRAQRVLEGRGAGGADARGARRGGLGARPGQGCSGERPLHGQGLWRPPGALGQERGRGAPGLGGLSSPHRPAHGLYGQGPTGPLRPAEPPEPGAGDNRERPDGRTGTRSRESGDSSDSEDPEHSPANPVPRTDLLAQIGNREPRTHRSGGDEGPRKTTSAEPKPRPMLSFRALGGAGEVGGSSHLLDFGDSRVLVDAGIKPDGPQRRSPRTLRRWTGWTPRS